MALPKEARACRHDLGVGGGASEICVVANARIPVASELSDQAHARKAESLEGLIVRYSKPGPAPPSRFDQIEVEFCKNSWFQNILACGTSRIFPSARLQVYARRPPNIELQAVEILLSDTQIQAIRSAFGKRRDAQVGVLPTDHRSKSKSANFDVVSHF